MNRNRVAPALGQKKLAHRATRNSHAGSRSNGASQHVKPIDEPDPGHLARPNTGVVLKCILSTHG